MKIKKGDKVKILCGKDRGKSGKVLKVMPKENKAVIEGLKLIIKHTKPRRQGEKGQRIQFPMPIDASDLMLVCPHCGKTTRINFTISQEKKKVRICKKCKQVI